MVIEVTGIVVGFNLVIMIRSLDVKWEQRKAYNLCDLSMAFGTYQSILVLIPFICASVAIDHLTARGRVEVDMRLRMRRHLPCLSALVHTQNQGRQRV